MIFQPDLYRILKTFFLLFVTSFWPLYSHHVWQSCTKEKWELKSGECHGSTCNWCQMKTVEPSQMMADIHTVSVQHNHTQGVCWNFVISRRQQCSSVWRCTKLWTTPSVWLSLTLSTRVITQSGVVMPNSNSKLCSGWSATQSSSWERDWLGLVWHEWSVFSWDWVSTVVEFVCWSVSLYSERDRQSKKQFESSIWQIESVRETERVREDSFKSSKSDFRQRNILNHQHTRHRDSVLREREWETERERVSEWVR